MTMRLLSFSALAARLISVLFLLNCLVRHAYAETHTTTKTLFSTTAITTETITISTHGTKITTLTTEGVPLPTEAMTWGSGHGNYSKVALKEQALNSTNLYRKQYESRALNWDARLAQYGQNHAQKCIWEHSGGPHGENMAEGFGSPTLAIDAWAGEESDYNWQNADFSESTGHFTQLVWQNTTRFGCGAVHCDNDAENGAHGWFMVCEYEPAGNIVGQFKYNVGKAGESSDGVLGFGGAARLGGCSKLLVALVAVSSLAAVCL